MKAVTLRGRYFGPTDLSTMKLLVEKYFNEGRTTISRRICIALDWRQLNGQLKDRACRDVLRQLHNLGIVSLPPVLSADRSSVKPVRRPDFLKHIFLDYSLYETPSDLVLEMAKGDESELAWNQLIRQFHYLGHTVSVGRTIKYLVWGDLNLIGAISFSSPSWKIAVRDLALQKLGIADIQHDVINNSRFLILPNVLAANAASRVLSLATKQVVRDWYDYYKVRPKIVETFVHSNMFLGTCYKAANWTEIGVTRGYTKSGPSHLTNGEQKRIFIYGLSKAMRKKIGMLTPSDGLRLGDHSS